VYAVVETGGKQYRVSVGDVLDVEKLDKDPGDTVELERVLMINDGENAKIGTPCVEGAKVIARIVEQAKARKVIVFKFKRRKDYQRLKGHRQLISRIKIEEIVA